LLEHANPNGPIEISSSGDDGVRTRMSWQATSACFFDDRSEIVAGADRDEAIRSNCSGGSTPSRHAGRTFTADRVNPDQEERSMKNRLVYLFAVVALVLALSFPVVAPAAPPAPKPQPTPAAAPAPERHHHIHEAIDALRAARADLMAADHDFGGHRAEAVGAIDASIHQLEICLQYDK
jgi:hypothetical protein